MLRGVTATAATGVVVTSVVLSLVGCAPPERLVGDSDRLQVVATTGILADLVRNVAGDAADVVALIPDGADPHTYELSLRGVRDIAYADVAFSNYLLLEPQALIRALDANLPQHAHNVSLAEGAVKYAAEIIPLVEDLSLDTIWLGLRVRGDGSHHGATRSSQVLLRATGLEGPGDLVAYLIDAFGGPDVTFSSVDGFDAGTGFRDDTAVLPPNAHTHMSWAFTKPGVYRLHLEAQLVVRHDERPIELGAATFTFAVGVDPYGPLGEDATVLHGGHADLAVDLDTSELVIYADPKGGGDATQREYDPAATVIDVPNLALHDVPPGPGYRFLGRPGDRIHQLPQAVLGRHIHGEIDPHLWHDVRNAMAYVELIRDTLIDADPANAASYRSGAATYLERLEALDDEVRATLEQIPPSRRHLVTTHDSFGYLAHAYGLRVSGFVTPHPSSEPSLADRRRLSDTIRNLDLPAVFLEPNLAARSATLTEVAGELGVEVCALHGDSLGQGADDYESFMRHNARSLRDCLAGDHAGASEEPSPAGVDRPHRHEHGASSNRGAADP